MILSTPAIVLKSIDFKESSKIVTLLTPDHGKFAVIVKGARKPKSKYAGYFETGNIVDVVVYLKSSRTVQNLNEVSYRFKNWSVRQDFEKLALVMAILEMVDQLVHENEAASDFFQLTEKMICWLNDTTENVVNVFPYIQLRFADLSGIAIRMDAKEPENNNQGLYLIVEDGLISSEPGIGLSFKLSKMQQNYVVQALQAKNSSVFRNEISQKEIKLLIHHLDVYFKHHIEGMRDRKSDTVFEQILLKETP
jgi:DNA repair protein RecO (recombination protein O)